MKRIMILFVGWTFILLGIAGLFLPILQGVLFLLVGLMILSSQYAWARRLLAYAGRLYYHEEMPAPDRRGNSDRD